MPFENTTVYLVLAFVAVLLLVDGVYALARDLVFGRGAMNRRLRLLAQGLDGATVMATLRRTREETGLAARLLAWPPMARLDNMLARAGLAVSTFRFLGLCAALAGLMLALGVVVLHLAPWKAAILAVLTAGALPLLWLRAKAAHRLRKLSEQLPDAVDMLVRSLRAGHPVASAIGLVGREMPDPIGSEFGLVFDEMTYGLDLRGALDKLAARLPVQDLHYLVVAVRIQFGTGGNLAEVLAGLSKVVRDRMRMKIRIRALSAEGRLSAAILSALPFVLAGLIFMIRPQYYLKALPDPAFLPLVGWGCFGIAMGILAMNRIVNFRF